MTYRADSSMFVSESACEDLSDRRKFGWLLGHDADGVLEIVDPLDENGSGIEVRRHPDMLRLEHPELTSIVDRFQTGAVRKLNARLYETLSAFEATCLLTMQGAHAREQQRHVDRMRKKGAE